MALAMISLVLIHGAFTGGWVWRRTARSLTALGFDAHAPSLTGCGERSHLLRPELSLTTHVEEVAQLLFYEDLDRPVLVGHGYGGMVAAAVAHRHAGMVAGVVHLDSVVPERGQSFLEAAGRGAGAAGSEWLAPPPPAESFGIECPKLLRWLSVRLQPFPRACLERPYPYGRRDRGLPAAFIKTASPAYSPALQAQASRASEAGIVELLAGPLPMVTHPERTAREVAAAIAAMDVTISGQPSGDRRLKRCLGESARA